MERPCPDRIPLDCGIAYGIGISIGVLWNGFKGFRRVPDNKFSSALRLARIRGPRMGGNFAVWGFLFSSLECALVAARKTEGPSNRILSGTATSALLAVRGGTTRMIRGAILGGMLFTIFEMVGYATNLMGHDLFLYETPEEQPTIQIPFITKDIPLQTLHKYKCTIEPYEPRIPKFQAPWDMPNLVDRYEQYLVDSRDGISAPLRKGDQWPDIYSHIDETVDLYMKTGYAPEDEDFVDHFDGTIPFSEIEGIHQLRDMYEDYKLSQIPMEIKPLSRFRHLPEIDTSNLELDL